MNNRSTRRKPFNEINVVPYIDVTLVLLLVFMITAPLIEQGVEVDLPRTIGSQIDSLTEDPVVVTVDFKGSLYVNIAEHPNKPIQTNEMLSLVTAVKQLNPDLPVLIRGEKLSAYGNIVKVMALLKQANIEKVGLMTESLSNDEQ